MCVQEGEITATHFKVSTFQEPVWPHFCCEQDGGQNIHSLATFLSVLVLKKIQPLVDANFKSTNYMEATLCI